MAQKTGESEAKINAENLTAKLYESQKQVWAESESAALSKDRVEENVQDEKQGQSR